MLSLAIGADGARPETAAGRGSLKVMRIRARVLVPLLVAGVVGAVRPVGLRHGRAAGLSRPQQAPSRPPAGTAAPSRRRRAAAGAARSSRRRASAPASTSSASTSIVTDKAGQAGPRPEAGRLHAHRGQQAAEDRLLLRRQDRRRHRRSTSGPPTRDPQRLRRGARGGASRRAAVRHPARRLPRAARQRHGGAQAAHRLRPEPARAGRTWSR